MMLGPPLIKDSGGKLQPAQVLQSGNPTPQYEQQDEKRLTLFSLTQGIIKLTHPIVCFK